MGKDAIQLIKNIILKCAAAKVRVEGGMGRGVGGDTCSPS